MQAEDMSRPRRRRPSWRFLLTLILLVALCYACAPMPMYMMVNSGLHSYRNTSPSLEITTGGVTLALAHSRYLTLETITVTLTNHSSAPIYLPEMVGKTMTGAVTGVLCWESRAERLSAHGWQADGSGCTWGGISGCGGGAAPPIPHPAVGVVAPGQTIILVLYEGQYSYPPVFPGVYRFSVSYALRSFQAPHAPWPWNVPGGVTLTTTRLTVSSPWWILPWYHQHLDCPGIRE